MEIRLAGRKEGKREHNQGTDLLLFGASFERKIDSPPPQIWAEFPTIKAKGKFRISVAGAGRKKESTRSTYQHTWSHIRSKLWLCWSSRSRFHSSLEVVEDTISEVKRVFRTEGKGHEHWFASERGQREERRSEGQFDSTRPR